MTQGKAITLYARDPEVWEHARIVAHHNGHSLSQHVERLLHAANEAFEQANLPFDVWGNRK